MTTVRVGSRWFGYGRLRVYGPHLTERRAERDLETERREIREMDRDARIPSR